MIVSGVNVTPPSVDLNTCEVDTMSALLAFEPLAPFAPLNAFDQLNTLLKFLPSTVTGIVNEPLEAKAVPVLAWIVTVVPLFESVNPLTLGRLPIVGVTLVAPL